jgi:hypothetical protein
MYRPSDIKTGELLHLWGWRQNHDVSEFTIADSLTQSTTGQYYQEIHPLLTLSNIKSTAPPFDLISYPAWDSGTLYRIGDRVTDDSKNYRAKLDNIAKEPETHPSEWERFDPFSEWLEQKTQASILKAVKRFWDEKMSEKTAKNILENKTLFSGTGRIVDVLPNGTNLVGFEIVPIRANGVTVKIEKIGLQFTDQGNVTLYLMHSSRMVPVQTITLTRTRNTGMEWFDQTDLYLPYISTDNDAGGSWYLIYRQNDLPEGVNAINKDKDWSAKPCGSCNHDEFVNWRVWSRYLEIHPFKLPEENYGFSFDEDFNDDFNEDFGGLDMHLWDISKNVYDYQKNWGINLQISIECDATDMIMSQGRIFQNIIGYQVAVDMLREMAYNPSFNINRTQQNFSKAEILYEIDGDTRGHIKSGLMYMYDKAMESIKFDISSMSKVCFPCNNRGLKYKTAY